MKEETIREYLKRDLGDHYEIVSKLGKGGYGHVYKVLERNVGKYWAIKVYIKENNSLEEKMKFKAIESESKMLSKLEFSGLPRFSDQIKSSNVNIKYLKMDYIDGVNLKEDMKQVYHVSALKILFFHMKQHFI